MLTRGLGCHPSGAGQGRERTEDGGREGKERRTEGREDLISFRNMRFLKRSGSREERSLTSPVKLYLPIMKARKK